MPESRIIKFAEIRKIDRGGGIATAPLIVPPSAPEAKITSGMSVYPKGKGAPLHHHNCDEQVTLLEGEGEVEVDGAVRTLSRYDTTYIQAGKIHAFRNIGEAPMRILWVYTSNRVTRTFAGSSEEVEHLSAKDLMG